MATIDALIVGAGPTGLTLALVLKRYGLDLRIIDAAPAPSLKSRAIALHPRTLEIFEDLGILPGIMAEGITLTGIALHGGDSPLSEISLESIESPYPFMLSIPQPQTEAVLTQALATMGVVIEGGKTLTWLDTDDFAATAQVQDSKGDSERIRVPWVIGCDGAQSTTRALMQGGFEETEIPGVFAMGDVKLKGIDLPSNKAAAILTPEGAVSFIPLPQDGYHRVITPIQGGDRSFDDPTPEALEALLKARLGDNIGLTSPLWIGRHSVHQRMSDTWRKGPIFLAGDGAHVHSPVGGQGLNTGIEDAYNLGWKLAMVISGRCRPDLLDSYPSERAPIARGLLRATARGSSVLTLQGTLGKGVTNALLGALTGFGGVRELVAEGLGEAGLNYRESPAVSENNPSLLGARLLSDRSQEAPSLRDVGRFGAAPRAGERAPDVPLMGQGGLMRLFNCTQGPHFTLLLFDGEANTDAGYAHLKAVATMALKRLRSALRVLIIVPGKAIPEGLRELPHGAEVLFDPGLTAHTRYGALAESLYLIRPDGYVGHRSQPAQAGGLVSYLEQVFIF